MLQAFDGSTLWSGFPFLKLVANSALLAEPGGKDVAEGGASGSLLANLLDFLLLDMIGCFC